jgi:hypothetical protein
MSGPWRDGPEPDDLDDDDEFDGPAMDAADDDDDVPEDDD